MDKMTMETPDMVQKNIDKLLELFPNCATEITDKDATDGKVKRGVDFTRLKQMLSSAIQPGREHYGFDWVGKKAAIVEANKPIRKTLRPCKEESKDWDITQNLYIEGDNLEALKILQESYLGKIKMIYIDPPYNTGDDYIYHDEFKMDTENYKEELEEKDGLGNRYTENMSTNGRYHSDWCNMIYPRLLLARNLLSDDGIIFVSIDYHENAALRICLDEIFGESNFVGEIYWESKTKSQNTKTSYDKLQPKAEMILVYGKNGGKKRFNLISKGKKEYPCQDEKGVYREYPLEVMNANGVRGRETMIYDITDGVSIVSPPEGKQWKLGQAQVAQYQKQNDLIFRDGRVIIKMRPEYEKQEKTEPFWGFFPKTYGTTESAKKELTEILGKHGFETVKPIEVIKRLIYHATDKNDVILDFFSGSATTAHAVMQLNKERNEHRKFILIQLPELCKEGSEAKKAGYNTICDLGIERIKRTGEKLLGKKEKLIQDDATLDIGLRVFKVDSTNMKDVYYQANQITQETLMDTVSNIKEDRTPDDLLFACLLDWGVPISDAYTSEQIDGCQVLDYGDGALIACFDPDVPESVVTAIAKRKPLRAVFRDNSFANSPARINVSEIFKRLSPETSLRVL